TKEPLSRPIRRPIFQRDKFDGVDSDDETSEEEEGEVEIDMDQEQEDFIRFSREMLGIDDDAWADIIADREKRGVYIPPSARSSKERDTIEKEKTPKGPNAAQFFDEIPEIAVTQRPTRTKPKPEDDSSRIPNPDLDSFEAVMDAMEKELAKLKKPPSTKQATRDTKSKGKAKDLHIPPRPNSSKPPGIGMDVDGDEDDEDGADMAELQQAMDLELRSALKRDMEVVSSGEEGGSGDEDDEMPMDYNLIKNFLESFKAQQGLSGPVGGLAGRLQGSDWALPRDG
ncbi:2413_t:CDS:2, partial [Acaulospora colombiana]